MKGAKVFEAVDLLIALSSPLVPLVVALLVDQSRPSGHERVNNSPDCPVGRR